VNRALESLERCTEMTRHYQLAGNDAQGAELEFYAQIMRRQKPRLILFGGWCSLYAAMIQKLRHPDFRFGVWWLSTAGQTDMSADVDRLTEAMGHARVQYFGCAQESLAQSLAPRMNRVAYLPVPMDSAEFEPRPGRRSGAAVLSLFCSPHEYRRKNITNTLLAVANLEEDYLLFLNGLSRSAPYRRLLRSLKVRYRDWGWMSDSAYRRKLDEVDIGLQLSFTESFNQVSAEHLARSIPVLASSFVPAMAAIRGADRQRLIVDSPEDSKAIRDRLRWLIRHPEERRRMGGRASRHLRELTARNAGIARRVLKGWTGL
jgi:glycosyltransferase involved in cell wall biosynthesis